MNEIVWKKESGAEGCKKEGGDCWNASLPAIVVSLTRNKICVELVLIQSDFSYLGCLEFQTGSSPDVFRQDVLSYIILRTRICLVMWVALSLACYKWPESLSSLVCSLLISLFLSCSCYRRPY